jgi:hypothetical protein
MIYDDPEDDLGNDLSPEERAVTRREPFNYDEGHDMDLLECEWMAELKQLDEDIAEEEAEERQRRSDASKRGWARRKAAKKRKPKRQVRSIDDPWMG